MNRKLIGTGVLSWPRSERISDRYGSVFLRELEGDYLGGSNYNSDSKIIHLDSNDIVGCRGKLVAVVRAIRQSGHIGDVFRMVFPKTPEIGQEIVLGEGVVFVDVHSSDFTSIGLLPDDGRRSDWLDIEALYQCHDQTVDLYFEPTNETET